MGGRGTRGVVRAERCRIRHGVPARPHDRQVGRLWASPHPRMQAKTCPEPAEGPWALAHRGWVIGAARPVSREPDDDLVLATALAANAELIVSRDKQLRNLKHFHRIPIVTAAEALARITQARASN